MLVLGLAVAGQASAQGFVPVAAERAAVPVVGGDAGVLGVAGEVSARVEAAAALVRSGAYGKAVEAYTPLVNVPDLVVRGQARYGLAVALSQLGRDVEALKALEGTSADDTELGAAVGDLRGNLVLQLAEMKLMETGTSGGYLNDYDRLTHKPNPWRAQRLRALEEQGLDVVPLTVGVLLPLSGPLAPVGQEVLRGLQLALTTGTVWRRAEVELVIADTATGAVAAFDDVAQRGAKMVLGPLLGRNVTELAGRAQAVGVPMLAFSSDADVAGKGVHLLPPLPTAQAQQVARWAAAQGFTRVGALVPSTPYGNDVLEAFQAALAAKGGRIERTAFFNPQSADLGAPVKQLAGGGDSVSGTAPFQALFAPVPAATVPLVTSQLAFYDFDTLGIKLLGTGLWQDEALLAPSNKAARGGVFAAPARPAGFIDQFRQEFGVAPQGMAIHGYDAGRLVMQLAAEKVWSGRDVALLLNRPEGFYGAGGFVRFRADGKTERGMALTEIGVEGTFHVLQPALKLAPVAVPANLMPTGRKSWGTWW